jgi:hypothetical protein
MGIIPKYKQVNLEEVNNFWTNTGKNIKIIETCLYDYVLCGKM